LVDLNIVGLVFAFC